MNETDLITITEAAQRSPGRPSTNCIWRWCRKGVLSRNGQRVRLQHLRIGGKIFTRQQWLDEFGAQVAAADAEYFDAAAPQTGTPRRRRPLNQFEQERAQQVESARRTLKAAGF